MRALFIIVGVLGLLLTGLGAFETRAARKYDARVRDVQEVLVALDNKAVAEAKKRGGGYEISSLTDNYGSRLDDIDTLERGWLVVIFAGAVVFVAGAAGVFITRRPYV